MARRSKSSLEFVSQVVGEGNRRIENRRIETPSTPRSVFATTRIKQVRPNDVTLGVFCCHFPSLGGYKLNFADPLGTRVVFNFIALEGKR